MNNPEKPGWVYWPAIFLLRFWFLFGGVKVTGRKNIPRTGALVACSNHVHALDPVVIYVLLTSAKRHIYFLIKEELLSKGEIGEEDSFLNRFSLFFQRFFNEQARSIPVNRSEASVASMRPCLRVLRAKCILGIFPEGTRNRTGSGLLEFAEGAAFIAGHARCPILPMHISWHGGRAHIAIGKPVQISKRKTYEEATTRLRQRIKRLGEEKLVRGAEFRRRRADLNRSITAIFAVSCYVFYTMANALPNNETLSILPLVFLVLAGFSWASEAGLYREDLWGMEWEECYTPPHYDYSEDMLCDGICELIFRSKEDGILVSASMSR